MIKDKLNLSIDTKLKNDFKHLAITHNSNCSELVEIFIKALKVNPGVLDALIATSKNHKGKNKKTR